MNSIKYRAKPVDPIFLNDEELGYDGDSEEWLENCIDEDGYVTGYLIGDIIAGPLLDCVETSLIFEWWIRIKPDTIEQLEVQDNED